MEIPPHSDARRIRELLTELSPLLEEYTMQVCPNCLDVCCKQRHGIPDPDDNRYNRALGEYPPDHDDARSPDGPCQFMGPAGCVLPRRLRPWRCTWYMCSPLLKAFEKGPVRKARNIAAIIQAIIDIRRGW